jgi:hypothetical protein
MRALAVAALALSLGCTSVRQEFVCFEHTACVLDGVAGYCEGTGYCSFDDDSCPEGRRYGPHAGAYTDQCVGGGDEVPDANTGDMPPGVEPPNDDPDSATHLEDSGSYPFDLRRATPSGQLLCDSGDPDVYFAITVYDTEVVYLDTLGSDTSIVLGSRTPDNGGCAMDDPGGSCVSSSCGDFPKGAQIAEVLEPGEYCVGVVGYDTTGTLRFVRGGRAGTPVYGKSSYDTCGTPDLATASCTEGGGGGGEDAFFATVCGPTTLSAFTGDGLPATLFLRRGWAFSSDLACGQGSVEETVETAGLYWLFVETSADCGAGTVSLSGP